MKAKITAHLETSDHDGYCSGNECEYECKIIEKIINAPDQYKNFKLGKIDNIEEYDWYKFLDEPGLNYYESYYCDLSWECNESGLDKHDFRYTIISVELGDENYFNEMKKLDMEKLDIEKIYKNL